MDAEYVGGRIDFSTWGVASDDLRSIVCKEVASAITEQFKEDPPWVTLQALDNDEDADASLLIEFWLGGLGHDEFKDDSGPRYRFSLVDLITDELDDWYPNKIEEIGIPINDVDAVKRLTLIAEALHKLAHKVDAIIQGNVLPT